MPDTSSQKILCPVPLWLRVLRTVFIGLLVSAAVAGALHIQTRIIPDLLSKLLEEGKENRAGFIEQMAYLAPVLAALLIPYLCYFKVDRHDGKVQTELTWVIVIVAIVTFCVLLPHVAGMSEAEIQAALAAGEDFPTRDGGAYDSLLLKVAPWFIRLFIGLSILLLYHACRARREKEEAATAVADEPAEAEEAPVILTGSPEATSTDFL